MRVVRQVQLHLPLFPFHFWLNDIPRDTNQCREEYQRPLYDLTVRKNIVQVADLVRHGVKHTPSLSQCVCQKKKRTGGFTWSLKKPLPANTYRFLLYTWNCINIHFVSTIISSFVSFWNCWKVEKVEKVETFFPLQEERRKKKKIERKKEEEERRRRSQHSS